METVRWVSIVLATALTVCGLGAVVFLELAAAERRRLVSPLRDTLEVLVPLLFTFVLLWQVWLAWL